MAEIPTPATVALVRRLYIDGVPVRSILAEAGITLGTLYRCLAGDFPDGSGIEPAPIRLRRAGVRIRQRMGSRAALVARLWRTAERQVEEVEARMKAAGLGPAEREGNARTLAIVVKTLRELTVLDEAKTPRRPTRGRPAPDDDDDDPVPQDIDEFRRELARRIGALVDASTGGEASDRSKA